MDQKGPNQLYPDMPSAPEDIDPSKLYPAQPPAYSEVPQNYPGPIIVQQQAPPVQPASTPATTTTTTTTTICKLNKVYAFKTDQNTFFPFPNSRNAT